MSAKKKTRKRKRYDDSPIAYIRRHMMGLGDAARQIAAKRTAEQADERALDDEAERIAALPKQERVALFTKVMAERLQKIFKQESELPPVEPGYIRFEDSHGGIHDVPAENWSRVLEIDPGAHVYPRRALPAVDWNACARCGSHILVSTRSHQFSWRYCCDCEFQFDLASLGRIN